MKITIEIDAEGDKEVKISISPSSKKDDSTIEFASLSQTVKAESKDLLKDKR